MNKQIKKINKLFIYIKTLKKYLNSLRYVIFNKNINIFLLGKSVHITESNLIKIKKNVKLESYSEIQGLSKNGIQLFENVTIGRNVMIRPSSYYGTGELGYGLLVKRNSSIGPFSYIGCAGFIEIGENVMIGPRVSLFAENHNFFDNRETIKSQGVTQKGIIIEDDCWIGSGVIILDGVRVGKGSIIAAGTLISKDIPPYSIVKDIRSKKILER